MKKITLLLLVLVISAMQLRAQVLSVKQVTQEQNQWCWAGVSECILDYYCTPTAQCVIAEYTRTVEQFGDVSFGSTPCCTSPTSCNNWNYNWGGVGSIQDILVHFANIANSGVGSSLSQAQITSDISNNRLFVIRWGYSSGGGHFLVGHGLVSDKLYYMDPWYGEGLKIADYSWVLSGDNHTWTHTNRITNSPASKPATPTISLAGNVLHSTAPYFNQWYNQSGQINGATSQDYTVTVDGDYYVRVIFSPCISEKSNTITVDVTGIEEAGDNSSFKVFPNPVSGQLTIEVEGNSKALNFEILNAAGQIVFKGKVVDKLPVETGNFSPGIYIIRLENGKKIEFKKIIKN